MLDGVFCYNDPLTIDAMNTILEAGHLIRSQSEMSVSSDSFLDPRLRFREYGSATQVKATFSRRAIPFSRRPGTATRFGPVMQGKEFCFLQCNPGQLEKCKYLATE
jgi:hypothetical protein